MSWVRTLDLFRTVDTFWQQFEPLHGQELAVRHRHRRARTPSFRGWQVHALHRLWLHVPRCQRPPRIARLRQLTPTGYCLA